MLGQYMVAQNVTKELSNVMDITNAKHKNYKAL